MKAGLIRPTGAQPAQPIDPNFIPYLAGVPITGVSGIGPTGYRSGSRFAVRCPDLHVTSPVSLMCVLDWSDAQYLGSTANPVLEASLGLYAVADDAFLGAFRTRRQLVYTDIPDAQSGGGSLLGRIKVDPGDYYVAGSFVGAGGAAASDYVVSTVEPILLEVRPVERSDVAASFYTRRTLHKLSVFDGSHNALKATTVWGESDAVVTVREEGTTVYIHSDAAHAEVAVHASNAVESSGARKTASTEQVYTDHVETNLLYGAISGTIAYGTPGVTY